jgi:protein-tyrosine phosphatase
MNDIVNFLTSYNNYKTNNKPIIRINKNIFIGGVLSIKYISKYNIKLAINLNPDIDFKIQCQQINFPLPDKIKKSDAKYYKNKFNEIVKIITEYAASDINILIYCFSGICKSPSIIIYLYIIKKNENKSETIIKILKKLKAKNNLICPNKYYIKYIFGKTTL